MKRLSVTTGSWEEVEVEVDHEGRLLNDGELDGNLMYNMGRTDFNINGMWDARDGVDGAWNVKDSSHDLGTGSVFGGGSTYVIWHAFYNAPQNPPAHVSIPNPRPSLSLSLSFSLSHSPTHLLTP